MSMSDGIITNIHTIVLRYSILFDITVDTNWIKNFSDYNT